MDALSLYVKASRMAMKIRESPAPPWDDIITCFDELHKLLVCAVCEKICIVPYKRHTRNCSHNVCKDCMGDLLLDPCHFCSYEKNFDENISLRVLLQSFKSLCKLIWTTEKLPVSRNMYLMVRWYEIIKEGANLEDNYSYAETQNLVPKKMVLLPRRYIRPTYRIRLNSKNNPKVLLKKMPYERRSFGVEPVLPRGQSSSGLTSERPSTADNPPKTCNCIGCAHPAEYHLSKNTPVQPVFKSTDLLVHEHLPTPKD